MDTQLRGPARIWDDGIKIQKLLKTTNKSQITRGNVRKMIINIYFTIIDKNKREYKRLNLGSENQLNENRMRGI